MAARLTVARGPLTGRSFVFDEEITLGRTPDNGVVVTHAQVSARHARVIRGPDGGYLFEDLDSRNGSFVAGSRIRGTEPLGRLDTIDLGGAIELVFQLVVDSPAGSARLASSANFSGLADPAPVSPWARASGSRPRPAAKAPTVATTPGATAPGATTPGEDERSRTRIGEAGWVLPEEVAEAAAAEEKERTMGGVPAALVLPPEVEAAAMEEERAKTMHGAPAGFVLPPEVDEEAAADAAAKLLAGASGRMAQQRSPPPPVTAPPIREPRRHLTLALEIQHGEGRRETVPLPPGEYVVGRSASCEVVIDKEALSRRHARLSIGSDGGIVVDLGSTNKTFVDGAKAEGEVRIRLGSVLRFGNVEAKLVTWEGP